MPYWGRTSFSGASVIASAVGLFHILNHEYE
jgi:hypothetical protein